MKLNEAENEAVSCAWQQKPLSLDGIRIPGPLSSLPSSNPWDTVADPRIYIWRVTRYSVVHWPEEEYGNFYANDAYLVLNLFSAAQRSASVNYELHLWMGRDAVTEDYLTSVVKLHELDTFLGKRGIVHREVQGFESGVFLKYFNPITLWKGSSDQNYRQTQVKKSNHSARLLVFFKPDPHMTQVIVKEVSTHGLELDNTRIYIMDLGSRLIQWIGCLVGTELALLGLKYTEGIRASRGLRSKVEVINEKLEEDESATLSRHPFYVYLSKDSYRSGRNGSQDLSSSVPIFPSMLRAPKSSVSRLSRIVKNKSKIEYQKVKEGNISLKDLEKAQFAIFENGLECYVWLSNKIPASDANVALEHSHNYLMNSKHPTVPVTILRESQNSAAFQKALVA